MALYCCSLKIHAAKLHFTISSQRGKPMGSPTIPVRGCTRPSPIHTLPTHGFFLRPKLCLTKLASAVAVGLAAAMQNSEDFCLVTLAVGTTHGYKPPVPVKCCAECDSL